MLIVVQSYDKIILGGGLTYTFRINDYLKKNAAKMVLLFNNNANSPKDILDEISNRGIKLIPFVYSLSGMRALKDIHKFVTNNDRIINIEDTSSRLVLSSKYLEEQGFKNNTINIFYPLFYGNVTPHGMFRKWLQRHWIVLSVEENAILYMDHETYEIATNYNHITRTSNDSEKMAYLGMPYSNARIVPRNKKHFVILAIARLDFPFKGFILGMLKEFPDYYQKNPNAELWVVGDGDGMELVRREFEKIPSTIHNRIKIMGSVNYEELNNLSKRVSVAISMGTSILDFAKDGIVSFTAAGYQYDTYCLDKLVDCLDIGGPIGGPFSFYCDDINKYKAHKAYELIDDYYSMNDDEASALQQRYKDTYNKYFNIDVTMNKIINQKSTFTYSNFSHLDKFKVSILSLYFSKIKHK